MLVSSLSQKDSWNWYLANIRNVFSPMYLKSIWSGVGLFTVCAVCLCGKAGFQNSLTATFLFAIVDNVNISIFSLTFHYFRDVPFAPEIFKLVQKQPKKHVLQNRKSTLWRYWAPFGWTLLCERARRLPFSDHLCHSWWQHL